MEHNSHPAWMYKPISVDNLEAIQQELVPVLYKEIPNFDSAGSQFVYVLREKIEPHAPLYTKFIESLGVLDRWHYSAFVTTNTDSLFVHVDSLTWRTRCYGLNLPLVNCEGTYTVFYDAEINDQPFCDSSDPINSAKKIKPGTSAREIARVEATTPMWVNTCIPHAPVTTHSRPRAIISARFRPELHDLLWA